MKYGLKNQSGYLTLIIAILIVTVAFTGLITSYVLSNKTLSVNNSLSSFKAYYLALSGIERATYDITRNNIQCTALNGAANYTDATFPNAAGTFTVTGTQTKVNNTLSSAITASQTTIPLTSTTGFAANGSISIDLEIINYTAISGNNLTGAIRGAGGTIAATHSSGTLVGQNQCVLNSIGSSPTSTATTLQRVIQQVLIGNSFSAGQTGAGGGGNGSGAGAGIFVSAMIVGGTVSLSGNQLVTNPTVTTTSANYAGSTILSGSTVSISGSAKTEVSNGTSLIVSSAAGSMKADIAQNQSQVSTANIWNSFFSASKATVQAASTQTNTVNGITGKLLWSTGISGNGLVIGSSTAPVILIVNGNVNVNNFTIYGLLYVTGTVSFQGSVNITGGFAVEGNYASGGNLTVTYSPAILSEASNLYPLTSNSYSTIPTGIQEQFI